MAASDTQASTAAALETTSKSRSTQKSPGIIELRTGPFDIRKVYLDRLRKDEQVTMPVAAIQSLLELLSQMDVQTISEFMEILQQGITALKTSIPNHISLSAGCDLFLRYIVRSLSHTTSLKKLIYDLQQNVPVFVQRSIESKKRIATIGASFITDDSTILTISHSRVVIGVLMEALKKHVRFRVIVCQGRGGEQTAKELRAKGVSVAVIESNAVAYVMSTVSMCIVGAEGVVENGGVINTLGTYQVAVLAKSAGKPMYVAAETHKFVRMYPLNGMDLPISQNVVEFTTDEPPSQTKSEEKPDVMESSTFVQNLRTVDHTPPDLISAIITEAGPLTPGAVSEELIKIWF